MSDTAATQEELPLVEATEVIQEPATEEVTQTAAPTDNAIDANDLKVAYIVGLTNEGNFIFQLLGKEKGLVELMGINAHANMRVKALHERSQGAGDVLIH